MLKKIRILISILILLLWIGIFFAETGFFIQLVMPLSSFQIFPAFWAYVQSGILPLGFIILMLITFFWGRVYCSSLCPLGTFQDCIIGISGKVRGKKFRIMKPYTFFRFSLFGLVIITLLSGSLYLIHVFEPFSFFGRIISDGISPLLYQITVAFEKLGLPFLASNQIHTVEWINFITIFFLSTMLIILSAKKGRIYCSLLCPVGAFLGITAKFSLIQIHLDPEKCISCGTCESICKACCMDSKLKKVDNTRCIRCFNCLEVCPVCAIQYKRTTKTKLTREVKQNLNKMEIDNSRRGFLLNAGKACIGTLAGFLFAVRLPGIQKLLLPEGVRKNPITPPGSMSLDHFQDSCIACHLCVSHCPTKVLNPSFGEYGLKGFMQPLMDYSKSYCDYECRECTKVCPTHAIKPLTMDEKKLIQLGKAEFIKKSCIVFTHETSCGACAEICPTTAVRMIKYIKRLTIPEMHPEICVGCGHCEHVCPAIPIKAIYVNGHTVHQQAVKINKGEILEDKSKQLPF